jgi:hypothetical protein
MFAQKSMDVNSNLLRLKLDMVYRDLPIEEAEKQFEQVTATVPETIAPPLQISAPKPKVVKTIRVKSK